MTPSNYQLNILDAVKNTKDNIIIQACAGSGKTTTLKMICDIIPRHRRTLAVCFNKTIATEFSEKLPAHIDAKTLHGLGLSIIRRHSSGQFEIDNKKIKKIINEYFNLREIKSKYTFTDELWKVKAVLPNACSLVLATQTNTSDIDEIESLLSEYDIPTECDISYHVGNIIDLCRAQTDVISFDDMIDFPLFYNMTCNNKYDIILIDECQDLNKQQLELVKKIAGKRGRVIAVGDIKQAIYAWRGAHSGAMEELASEFDCVELPLSICYRCATSIVQEAQKTVGNEIIQSNKSAPIGTVIKRDCSAINSTINELKSGDMVVCRTNAPLVFMCLQIIAAHKKAHIRGKDFGTGLIDILNKTTKNTNIINIDEFCTKLDEWKSKKRKKLENKKFYGAIQRLEDRVDTLKVLTKHSRSFSQLENTIKTVFTDDNKGIVLSTIHKAKGLEADKVVFLGPELLPHKMALKTRQAKIIMQERNLEYVAKTRAKNTLIYQKLV